MIKFRLSSNPAVLMNIKPMQMNEECLEVSRDKYSNRRVFLEAPAHGMSPVIWCATRADVLRAQTQHVPLEKSQANQAVFTFIM